MKKLKVIIQVTKLNDFWIDKLESYLKYSTDNSIFNWDEYDEDPFEWDISSEIIEEE